MNRSEKKQKFFDELSAFGKSTVTLAEVKLEIGRAHV